MGESFAIAAFRSRQQVMRFEDALRRNGLKVGIVTTPREVAMGCGLSVRFDLQDAEVVRRIYHRVNPGNLIGFYRVDHIGGRPTVSLLFR